MHPCECEMIIIVASKRCVKRTYFIRPWNRMKRARPKEARRRRLRKKRFLESALGNVVFFNRQSFSFSQRNWSKRHGLWPSRHHRSEVPRLHSDKIVSVGKLRAEHSWSGSNTAGRMNLSCSEYQIERKCKSNNIYYRNQQIRHSFRIAFILIRII